MKFRNLMSIVVAVALVAAYSVAAQAALINLSIQYNSSTDNAFTPIGTPLNDVPPTSLPGDFHQFDVYMELSDMMPTEDFQALQFDIDMGPGITSGGFWVANNPLYDPPGPPPASPIFSSNADGGGDATDLQRIIVIAANAAAMAATMPGEPGPFLLGSAYVQWDGTTEPTFVGVRGNGDQPWGTFKDGQPVTQSASSLSTGPPFDIGGGGPEIPEPASIVLFGLAMVGLLGLRRRS